MVDFSFIEIDEGPISIGDTVSVRHDLKGKQYGTVMRSHYNFDGEQIIEVKLDSAVYHYPLTRVRRVVRSLPPANPLRTRTIERRIYW
ncbi:hypothetical protein F5887DRAFT_965926 [Amanita rubescens]|nr:hypothetical protein F5887DRAFT_965926 [Amanita rubescens]